MAHSAPEASGQFGLKHCDGCCQRVMCQVTRRPACDVGALSLSRHFAAILAVGLHLIDPAEGVGWSELSPSGGAPTGREGHSAVWSTVANGFYLYGGWEGDRPLALQRPGGQREVMDLLQVNEVGCAGGSGCCGTTCWDDEVRCLLWERCCPKREEACHGVLHKRPTPGPRLSPTGGPPSNRVDHVAVWADVVDGFYIFGGWAGS